ncbi:MAG: nitrate reductase catalytic subunit [Candidatus Binatia bacterium]|nr:MAG: nitrate reductase catalytic subunit [Candidatus Binatia bacterium]
MMGSLLRTWWPPRSLAEELARVDAGGGLGQVPARLRPQALARVVCGYCSTGCGLLAHLREGEAVNVSPAPDYPVNLGKACPKGWQALAVLDAPDRALVPLWRSRSGGERRLSWHEAIELFVRRVRETIERYGRESVAFLGTGQLPSEELAFFGALAKFGMGLIHGDGNTRQCMASAVVAYKECFGFDAPPYTYADLEESEVIVLVGANLAIAHPILWERVLRNRQLRALIVIDPRRTETAAAATMHVRLAPKSDLVLFYGLAHLLLREGWYDRSFVAAHTVGFEAFAAHVAAYPPERVAAVTGVPAETLMELARQVGTSRRVSFWWTMGVNQSYEGTRVAQSLIALALLTGNIGRPGTGPNSVTGQCNAMGSRLFANTSCLLGGRNFSDPVHRRQVASVLGIDEGQIPVTSGFAYPEIVEGIASGKIRALWVVGTNPLHSWINRRDLEDLVSRLDFLVVQDMYASTETARRADLFLPAAAWGEKWGTFINSERRIGLIRPVRRPPGEAQPDFAIFQQVAEAWGVGPMFRRWRTPQDVFAILRELSRGQPCDFTGIPDYDAIERAGGIQWPWPEETAGRQPEVHRRLFTDGKFFHADGKARFVFGQPSPLPEPADEEFPLLLLTGRGTAAQWHTQTRTSKAAVLRRLYPPAGYVEIHPADAQRYGLTPGCEVVVESRRAKVRVRACITPTIAPGQVFMPMHYPETNLLTAAVFDPHSRQPSYKACAVRVRPAFRWEEE